MEKKLNYKEIGCRIRNERENLNLSREKFAELLEISPYYLGQIERGDRRMSLEILIRITSILHVPVDYILFGIVEHIDGFLHNSEYLALESCNDYNPTKNNDLKDLIKLLSRCTTKEISLIKELTNLIIPYIKS